METSSQKILLDEAVVRKFMIDILKTVRFLMNQIDLRDKKIDLLTNDR